MKSGGITRCGRSIGSERVFAVASAVFLGVKLGEGATRARAEYVDVGRALSRRAECGRVEVLLDGRDCGRRSVSGGGRA
jgi:hypothetical protein